MDPLRTFCRQDIIITPDNTHDFILDSLPKLSLETQIPLIFKKDSQIIDENVPQSSSQISQSSKKSKLSEDPFSKLELTPFKNRSAYDLASIDLFFDITNSYSGNLAPQVLKFQDYVISGTRNYGFIEYIQYKNPISYIYFLEDVNIDDNEDIPTGIVYGRINQLVNRSVSSQNSYRYQDQTFYTNGILRATTSGVSIYIIEDYKSNIELLTQCILMLLTLKNKGKAILKITLNEFTQDLMSALAASFDSIALFKPATVNLY